MKHFFPERMIFVYRPGCDKTLYNLLRFSPIPIDCVVSIQCNIPETEKQIYRDLNPEIQYVDNLENGLKIKADTVIWGREVFETKLDYHCWKQTMLAAVQHKKNIYNLARLNLLYHYPKMKKMIGASRINYWEASTHAFSYANRPKFGEINPYQAKAKTILFLGTERRCGKFTTTQIIRKKLTQYNIKTAELATEPYGLLTGANEVIIPQTLKMWNATPTINQIIAKLDQTLNPQFIMVSSQSGLRSRGLDAAGRCGGIIAYSIALGASPDACVMSTPLNTFENINLEKQLVEIFLRKPVIGISIKDKNHPYSPDTFRSIQSAYTIPVFDPLRDDDIVDQVAQNIIKLLN